jgi:hypothetical protein
MALDEGLRCRHGDGAPGCCCESVTWWCRSRQRSGSARSAELAWATPARRAPGRPAMVGGGGRGQDESDGSGGDSSKTTATSTSTTSTTTTTEPPLRILVVHALDKVSCTQSPVSGLDDYDATFTVDITTEGTGTVSYQWAGAPPTPGPRRVRTRPAQGRQGRGPEPCLRARRQPAARMVERFHVLEPYGVDRAPLTHTVFVRLAAREDQRSARHNAASRRTHHAEPRRVAGWRLGQRPSTARKHETRVRHQPP